MKLDSSKEIRFIIDPHWNAY